MRSLNNADETTGKTASHLTKAASCQVIGYGLFILLGLLFPVMSWAVGVGTVTHLGGVLHAMRDDGSTRLLSLKSEIREGDTLKTSKNTFARIRFVDGGEIVLRPETVFEVDAYSYDPSGAKMDSAVFKLLSGGLRSVTGLLGKRSPDAFRMKTAVATIGIRGTHFGALLCNNDCGGIQTISGQPLGNGLHTDTASGKTVITNAAGAIEVPAGGFSYTAGPNVAPKIVPPSQGIQVTMPPSISSNKGSGQSMSESGSNACSVQ